MSSVPSRTRYEASCATRCASLEVDENLARETLIAAEKCEALTRRKGLYLAIHLGAGPGKASGKMGSGKKAKTATLATFAQDATARTGRSRPSIDRDVAQRDTLG